MGAGSAGDDSWRAIRTGGQATGKFYTTQSVQTKLTAENIENIQKKLKQSVNDNSSKGGSVGGENVYECSGPNS